MRSHGWQLIGSKENAGDAATAIPAIQTDFNSTAVPKLFTEGYSYVAIALLHTEAAQAPIVDVYGGNFLGSPSQNNSVKGTVFNSKLCTVTGFANGVSVTGGTVPGVDADTEWSSIVGITDVAASGDGEMMGMLSIYGGFSGPAMSDRGSDSSDFEFGNLASKEYVSVAGSDSILGYLIVPCSLYSVLQFDLYSSSATNDVSVIGCAFG